MAPPWSEAAIRLKAQPGYRLAFRKAFGEGPIDSILVVRALAQCPFSWAKGLGLTKAERQALLAFLGTLNDSSFVSPNFRFSEVAERSRLKNSPAYD